MRRIAFCYFLLATATIVRVRSSPSTLRRTQKDDAGKSADHQIHESRWEGVSGPTPAPITSKSLPAWIVSEPPTNPSLPVTSEKDGDDDPDFQFFNICRRRGLSVGLSCRCSPLLWPPSMKAECETQETVCFPNAQIPIMCGQPTLTLDFGVQSIFKRGWPLALKLCYRDMTVVDRSVPPFPLCFGLGGGLLDLVGSFVKARNIFPAAPAVSADSTDSTQESCTAALGDKDCESCTFCSNDSTGQAGLQFHCGNLPEVQSLGTLNCSSSAPRGNVQ